MLNLIRDEVLKTLQARNASLDVIRLATLYTKAGRGACYMTI